MAELKRNFLSGSMEIDLDDRVIPAGKYRWAENISVSRSNNSDVGAIESLRGNREIAHNYNRFSGEGTEVTIGSVRDDLNDKIYWFFLGSGTEGIYEFDISVDNNRLLSDGITPNPGFSQPRNIISRVVEFSTDKQVLNFDVQYLITGVNVIGDLLYWTDGKEEPRKINIRRFKGSGNYFLPVNGIATPDRNTKGVKEDVGAVLLSDVDPEYDSEGNPLIDLDTQVLDVLQQPAFHGDLISVAKRPPLFPPKIVTPSITFPSPEGGETTTRIFNAIPARRNYEVESFTGEYEDPAFMDVYVFSVSRPWDITTPNIVVTSDLGGVTTTYTAVEWMPGQVQSDFLQDEFIYFPIEGQQMTIIYSGSGDLLEDSVTITYTIADLDDSSALPAQSGDFLYDNFAYFAYRYKYRDGEVTSLSPFSPPAFFPRDFDVQREPASLLSMVNRIANIDLMYDSGSQEVVEIELVVTTSNDPTLKSLAIINKEENGIASSTPYNASIQTFTYNNNKVYTTLPSSELTRIYDDVPLIAKAQDIIGNRLVYGNYVQGYNISKINADGDIIVPKFDVDYTSTDRSSSSTMATPNLKSDRDYQVGIVYLDLNGRQSAVLITDEGDGDSSSVHVNFSDNQKRNRLTIDIKSPAPYWATHYRFFIKQTQGDFSNVFPKGVIKESDTSSRLYVQLDSSEVNKIQEDTTFVLKGNSLGVQEERRVYRVDPYFQGGSESQSGFTLVNDPDGGFSFSQEVEGISRFDVPFDIVQEKTNDVFAQRLTETDSQTFSYKGTDDRSYELTEVPEDATEVTIISITDLGTNGEGTTVIDSNAYHSTGKNVTLLTIQSLVSEESIRINYSYRTPNLEAEERNDYYISVVPVNANDMNQFPDAGVIDSITLFETVPQLDSVADIYFEHGETFRAVNGAHTNSKEEFVASRDICQQIYRDGDTDPNGDVIDSENNMNTDFLGDAFPTDEGGSVKITLQQYFTCYSYIAGIEETKILGKFNNPMLRPGIRASTVNDSFRQVNRESWLIHSGLFNDNINLNRLNQFPTGQSISKELDIAEGSIQKIHSRNTNLIVFQEDKTKNVPIQKNLIQTANAQIVLTRDSQFFGTESSYLGEYGISKNPESFHTYGSIIYFADRNRGALCRLAGNQVEEISQRGVESYVKTQIRNAAHIFGSHDDFNTQSHWSFRNPLTPPIQQPNLRAIDLSEDGSPGPRSECNRNEDLINFKRFFSHQADVGIGIQVGDSVFLDGQATSSFNGNYRWYRIQDTMGTNPDRYNRIMQISPYGVITGIVRNPEAENDPMTLEDETQRGCSIEYPPDLPRDGFDISSVGYSSEFEACANGIVDSQAYHDGSGNEPINGNRIYEGRFDKVQSKRTDWFVISVGPTKYTIRIDNGVVKSKIPCTAITAGRRHLLGSGADSDQRTPTNILHLFPLGEAGNPQPESEGLRNLRLCNAPFAEEIWWHNGVNERPEVGDTIYENNHLDELATNISGYIAFSGGYFVRLTGADADGNGSSIVDFVGLCSSDVCFETPTDLVTQDETDPFTFSFAGIETTYTISTDGSQTIDLGTLQAIPNAEINYVVQGQRRYPEFGTYKVNAQVGVSNDRTRLYFEPRISSDNTETTLGGENVTPLQLGSSDLLGVFQTDSFTLPAPNNEDDLSENVDSRYAVDVLDGNINVIITSICYRGITSSGAEIGYLTSRWDGATPATNGELCGNEATDTVYYFTSDIPRIFYESPTRIAFQGTAGTYGFSDSIDPDITASDDGGFVNEIVTLSDEGTQTGGFQCIGFDDTYLVRLGFTNPESSTALIQGACNAFEFQTDNRVSVYCDQPIDNFADDTPETMTNPGNPPTALFNAMGNPADSGIYSGGIYPGGADGDGMTFALGNFITRTWDAETRVLGLADPQGCSVLLTATMTRTSTISTSLATPIFTDSATSGNGVVNNTLQAAGDIDESWSITSRVQAPTGFRFVSGSLAVSIDGAGAMPQADGIHLWTDEWDSTHLVAEPTREIVWSGVLEARPDDAPQTYDAILTFQDSVPGATTSGFDGTLSGNSVGDYGLSNGAGYSVRASIALDSPTTTRWVPGTGGPFLSVNGGGNQGGSSYTHTSSVSGVINNADKPASVIFSGTVENIPSSRTFTLNGSGAAANTSIIFTNSQESSANSIDLSEGQNGTITATLTADPGWQIISLSPDSRTFPYTFSYADVTRSDAIAWTGVVANRFSASLLSGGTIPLASIDSSPSTFYFNAAFGSATALYTGATSSTLAGEVFLLEAGAASGRQWTGSSFTSFDAVTISLPPSSFTNFSDSSSQNACTIGATSSTFTNDAGQLFTTASGVTLAATGYYRVGSSWSFWNSTTGTITSSGRCNGVYVDGSSAATAPGRNILSLTSQGNDSVSIEIVGVTATFTPSGGLSGVGNIGDNRGWDIVASVGGTDMSSQETFFAGIPIPNSSRNFVFSPTFVTISTDGVYTASIDIGLTNLSSAPTQITLT